MKKVIIFCLIVFLPTTLLGVITFERFYPNTGRGYSVQQTTDGGYIITGGREKVLVMKTDSLGDTLWVREYGEDFGYPCGYSVQQTSDNCYIITGEQEIPPDNRDVYLIKVAENGDSLWAKRYGGNYGEYGRSVLETSDDGFIIVGNTGSFGSGQADVYIIKTDSAGDTLWTRTKGGGGSDGGFSIQQLVDNGYIISGVTNSYGPGNVYLIRTDSIGSTIWQRAYGGSGSEIGHSIQKTSDGGSIIAGGTNSFGSGADDVYLIKTDSFGDTVWTGTYGGYDFDYGYSVVTTINNEYVVVGHTKSYGIGGLDIYLIKVDSLGNLMWQKTFGGNGDELGRGIQKTTDGGYIIVGYRDWEVYLIKTDSEGNVAVNENPSGQIRLSSGIEVTPNPFFNFTNLKLNSSSNVKIYDFCGRFRGTAKSGEFGTYLEPGIYFLKVNDLNSKKVIKLR